MRFYKIEQKYSRIRVIYQIFKLRYLCAYLELEKNKNIWPHLLVEICSFPGSFEMDGDDLGVSKYVFLTKNKTELKK